MNRIFAVLAAAFIGLSLASVSVQEAEATTPCVCTNFKTQMIKEACQKGGQPAAKDAMKKFMKEKHISSCNQCHAKLAPTYKLKPDGLAQFFKLGGQ
jgi:hypothetical protein